MNHPDFEMIRPSCGGNGRIGRVIIDFRLLRLGLPRLITPQLTAFARICRYLIRCGPW